MKTTKNVFLRWIGRALFACALAQTSEVLAAETRYTGTIDKVRVDASGYGIIYFPINVPGASCRSESTQNILTFNANTEGGKGILQIALAAQLAGRQVNIVGTNTCIQYGSSIEEAARIYLL
jgi:hypothetical protein